MRNFRDYMTFGGMCQTKRDKYPHKLVKFSELHAWGFWIVNRDGLGQGRPRGKPKYITSLASMPVWQRKCYDHDIRNEPTLNRIRQYIADNPAR